MKKFFLLFVALISATVMNLHATYYMAGNGSATNNWCCGINWSADGCAMTDGAYSTKVPAGTYEFKITEGDWAVSYGYSSVDASASTPGYEGSDNVKFTVASEANINVLFDGMYIVLTSDVPFGSVTVTSWTIAGDEALMGSKWDPEDTNNDMSLVGGAYQLVKQNVELAEGGYDYKACANHNWGIKEIPASGNQTLQIDADGTYDVTFSLDAQGTTLSAEAVMSKKAAELNIFATNVAVEEMGTQVTVSYDLNAPATAVTLQLLSADNQVLASYPITEPAALTKGSHMAVVTTTAESEETNVWAIKAQAAACTEYAEVTNDSTDAWRFYSPQGIVINSNVKSPFFGQVYVTMPSPGETDGGTVRTQTQNAGLYVLNSRLEPVNEDAYQFGLTFAKANRNQFKRIAIDPVTDKLYVNDATNKKVYVINPKDFTKLDSTIEAEATFTIPTAVAADAEKLYVFDNPQTTTGAALVGINHDGVVDTILQSAKWANAESSIALDNHGGFWVCQWRGQIDVYPAISHVGAADTIDFMITSSSPQDIKDLVDATSNYDKRGAMNVNKDGSLLALCMAKKVRVYQVTYDPATNIPALTTLYTTPVFGTNIDGIAFDAADNLYISSASTERLYVYSTPKEDNAFTTPMTTYKRLEKPAPQLNIFASQVAVAGEGTDLEIHYVLNAKANELALVLVEDATGNILSTNAITDMAKKTQGKHQFNITVAQACAAGQHWAIQASAAATTEFAEITNDTTDAFKFYLPQGIAVNNNPESKFFGQVYVTMPCPGESDGASAHTKTQKAGLYVLDASLKAENDEAYQFGLTFAAKNRSQFKRVKVGDDGSIYVNRQDAATCIYKINPANMGAVAETITDSKFTKIAAFVPDGKAMWVLDLGESSAVYKVEAGVAAKIAESATWINADVDMAADGRGGVWIAQNRWGADAYSVLTHVTADGKLDFKVDKDAPTTVLDLFPRANNISYRGTLALNSDKSILAFGGNKVVSLFAISYDESTGVPSLDSVIWRSGTIGTNIDGIAFDAADNLYFQSASVERLYVYATPKAINSFISPATGNEMPGTIHVDSIVVTPKESTPIEVGDPFTFSAAIFPANATDKSYTWSIADTTIATISEKGVVTAVAKGTTKVFAVSNDNPAAIDSAVVNVIDKIWYYPNIMASRLALTPANTEGEFLVEYTLNAPADSVKLILKDVNEKGSEIALKGLAVGANSETVDLSKLNSGTYNWSIKAFAPLASDEDAILSNIGSQDLKLTTPRGVVVDNNPASPYFGEVYVTDSKNLDTVAGFYVYDPTLVSDGVLHTGKWGAKPASPMRIVIGEDDGLLYISDWSDIAPNIHIVDPANLDEETLVFGGKHDTLGVFLNEAGDSIHGSMPSCWVRGKGADRILYTFDEDLHTGLHAQGLFQYNIGELAAPWEEKPSAVVYDNADNYQQNGNSVIIPDAFGGWWISQDRAADGKEVPALIHMNAAKAVDFVSGGLLGGRTRAALAFNADQSMMVSAADNSIIVWIVEWNETTKAPSISKDYTISTTYGSQNSTCLYSLAVDAALNIYAVVDKKPLQVWAAIVEENTTNIPGGEVTLQNAGQGIQEISNEPVQGVRKEMRNGNLVIIRDNKEYNAIGAQL